MRIFWIFIPLATCALAGALPKLTAEKINSVIHANAGGGQLSFDEYALIAETISKRRPCNILIFGTGNDTGLWMDLNRKGKTIFLEDNQEWLAKTRARWPKMKSHLVTYNTRRADWSNLLSCKNYECLNLELPKEITQTRWDIIFVDGPFGGTDSSPGRMKSIYTASKFAAHHKNVDVFVHDCNRTVEHMYSDKFLGSKNLVRSVRLLRHYHIPKHTHKSK